MRHHPILSILGLLALAGLITVSVFLCTFDLNRYREHLETKLTAALSQPVHLGQASLSLRHGPALDFANLRIGSNKEKAEVLCADRLFLKPEILPLLLGKITFTQILLEAPRFNLTLPKEGESPKAAFTPLLDQSLWGKTLIRSLAVQNGTLHVIDNRDPNRPHVLVFEEIKALATDLSLNQPVQIKLAGNLIQQGMASPFNLAVKFAPTSGMPRWQEADLQLALELHHFSPAPLLKRYASDKTNLGTDGQISLQLEMKGSPSAGLHVDGELTGEKLALHLPDLYSESLGLQIIRISGIWTAAAEGHRISGLTLNWDDLSVSGHLSLQNKDGESWLEGNLSSTSLSLPRLSRFIPDLKPSFFADVIKERLTSGTFQLLSARFAGPMNLFRRFDETFPLQEAAISVQNGELSLEKPGTLKEVSFSATLKENQLSLAEGKVLFMGSPFQFSGALSHPFQAEPKVKLEASGTLSAEALLQLAPAEYQKKISASGPVPVNLVLGGTTGLLTADLHADLKDFAGHLEQGLTKPAGLDANLFLTGEMTPSHLVLSDSRLYIPPLVLRAKGSLGREEKRDFRLTLDIPDLDMLKARSRAPILEKLKTRGNLALHYELEGSKGEIRHRGGSVSLRNFGLHITKVIADVNEANGQILLSEDRAQVEHLSAKLGTSPVNILGSLQDFSNLRIKLGVKAKAIRADELIFPTDQAMLRDVDGKLIITQKGIDFDTVKVRLDGGTDAVVRGSVKGFKKPQVNLHIEAEQADINEVIGLWHRPQEVRKQENKNNGKGSVFITALAREGTLGGMHFQNAEGDIAFADGVLTLHPLQFSAGKGHCSGQVLVNNNAGSPPLLKISGHAENFDAAEIYHELLEEQGLVSGALSGDFHLEGRTGKDFLPTSAGTINLKVKNGVLRKFSSLSKVFSLLNVSQIFTLKLPDMSREGMPFERLKGNFTLQKGVLSTEDFFVKSNAMNLSLVGDMDLYNEKLDLILGVKPLRTVDKIVTNIPIAGWLLTGEEKALITVHFQIKGKTDNPEVIPIPITSVSEKILGIFKRTLGLPGKFITDLEDIGGGEQQE